MCKSVRESLWSVAGAKDLAGACREVKSGKGQPWFAGAKTGKARLQGSTRIRSDYLRALGGDIVAELQVGALSQSPMPSSCALCQTCDICCMAPLAQPGLSLRHRAACRRLDPVYLCWALLG